MINDYETLKKIQHGSLPVKRLKKLISLFLVGFTYFINSLIDKALLEVEQKYTQLEKTVTEFSDSIGIKLLIFLGLINKPSLPNKEIQTSFEYLKTWNTISYIIFLISLIWVITWVYADSYCISYETKTESAFIKRMGKAIIVNVFVYFIFSKIFF